MSRITETVGRRGIKSSPVPGRIQSPRAGDLVEWPDGQIGRIDGQSYHGDDRLSVCSGMGDAFMQENGSLSVSGGPFFIVAPDELEPALRLHASTFWNWGDNVPGAGMGCEFTLHRPLFRYVGDPERIYTHRQDDTTKEA